MITNTVDKSASFSRVANTSSYQNTAASAFPVLVSIWNNQLSTVLIWFCCAVDHPDGVFEQSGPAGALIETAEGVRGEAAGGTAQTQGGD